MRLIDDLVITEESSTIYIKLPCYRKLTLHELLHIDHNAPWLHPKILPIDCFQLF